MDMTEVGESSADGRKPLRGGPLRIDTTHGSVIHLIGRSSKAEGVGPMHLGKAYAIAAAATYLPLVVSALLSGLPLATLSDTLKLPFLKDWNVAFLCLVSFPSLAVLTLSDQHTLSNALSRVQEDGIVSIVDPRAATLAERWQNRFLRINILAQVLGVVVGLTLAVANARTYTPPSVGFWIAADGRLLPVGYVFLYCIAVFYGLITVYVVRSISTSLFLRDLVAHSQVRTLPLHPDKCGGLRPVGRLGLRNQYALSIFGVNVVLLVVISRTYLDAPSSLNSLIAAASIAYVVLGPIVFMGPLLPFRGGMLRTKSELMKEVASRLRVELLRMRGQLANGHISRDDEELIDRIRKIGSLIDELPVWPFDAGTLRRFLTVYVVPLIGAIGLSTLSDLVRGLLRGLRT